jgi:hypothetical protein
MTHSIISKATVTLEKRDHLEDVTVDGKVILVYTSGEA